MQLSLRKRDPKKKLDERQVWNTRPQTFLIKNDIYVSCKLFLVRCTIATRYDFELQQNKNVLCHLQVTNNSKMNSIQKHNTIKHSLNHA